jgi:calmodulin
LASFGEEVSDEEIVNRMRMWDGDGDGKINFPEFLIAMAQILTDTENEERMREAFRIFDKVCNC